MAKDNMDRFEQLYRWLKPQLRRLCRRWPPYYQVLNKARIVKYIPTKSGTGTIKRVVFECAMCYDQFKRTDVQIDHKDPIVDPALGEIKPDFNTLIERMFCGEEGLQILCKACHSVKTQAERAQRTLNRVSKPKKKRRST